MQGLNEHGLVARLREKDPRAMHEAWSRHRAHLFGFLLRLSRRREVAEELLQETFLSLVKAAPRLHENTNLGAFLFTIARNQWRSHRRTRGLELEDGEHEHATENDLDDDLDARRQLRSLKDAIAELPASDRELLVMIGVDGLEPTETAAMLGVKPDAVRQRLSRARAKLRGAMRKAALPALLATTVVTYLTWAFVFTCAIPSIVLNP